MAKLESSVLNRLTQAYMTDANGNESILTGALPFGQLSVPRHIDIAGDYLYWYDDPLDDYKRDKANDTGALNAFVRIKTPDDILRFARRYGPLGLCKHGLSPMHRGTWYRNEYENGELVGVTHTGEWNPASGASERGWCPPCGPEPIKRWLEYSGRALSYLNLAASLKVGTEKRMRGLRQLFLQDRINEWLGDAGIRLELNWSGNEPALTLVGGSVFGAIGVQLLTAVTSYTRAVCSGCGIPYLREGRKPKPGQRNFCPDCHSKGVPSRLRQRKWQIEHPKPLKGDKQ